MKYSCVLLDRDGVINHDSDNYIRTPEDWQPIPGSLDAIAKLTKAGLKLAVVTNQSGVGRGYYSEQTLASIHAKMLAAIHQAGGDIVSIYYCPHTPDDNCHCRKPESGLIEQALIDLNVNAKQCILVGDSTRDIMAAYALDIDAVLVETGNGLQAKKQLNKVPIYKDLVTWTEELLHGN